MRDKSHTEFIERWADYVKSAPREKWKAEQAVFINSVFKKAEKFYKNLEKTEEGRKILERLRKERMRVK